ncbi:peptidase S8 [Streptomyces sp. NRRL F-4489]|uniref:S8 family serine peptidase n=1 Tax=Streptomyces sp. NRRL F-4489 TaxID=1609095 RepID=UPI00074A6719|nr:S8 family serine peptidase [Streptomyces sp. NRRL F-4489]KUL43111.1 peptidase S8 [Streptomyces sp. NRRL F-4489]
MARPLAHPRKRRLRALAVPVGLALTASLGFLPGAAGAAAPADSGPLLSYVVNTVPDHATVGAVERAIDRAGGKVITAHERIGVIVAHSANPRFAATLRTTPGVQSAGATRTAPLKQTGTDDVGKPQRITAAQLAAAERTAKAKGGEPLEPLQWDLPAIKADQAAKVNPGSRKVTVAVIDTGVDDTHPDLKPNFSARQSANCVGGVPDTSPGAWRPYDPVEDAHGTHVAGTIAAARNGVGVAGVAPGVKVSAIKVSEPKTSLFYAESVVCAFVFAADHGVQVTNNSYYVDPWMFNCKDDADQAAIVDAVGRAAKYAQDKGVVNVAAAGNANADLAADKLTDTGSPNDSTPVTRTLSPKTCWDVPTQLPGTVTVAATGSHRLKSGYSNYGLNQIDVAAPGGDSKQLPDLPAKNGNILSTIPGGDWAFYAGTSMASPHVAGVAALLKSAHPKAGPQEIQWLLKQQADNPGCPATDRTCTGTPQLNSHFGYGIVNALKAVE